MIVPPRIALPLAFLVTLFTVTVVYDLGIVQAPREFFGASEDTVLFLPAGGEITSEGSVPAALAMPLRQRPNVSVVSPETVIMTTLRGSSTFVRGVEAESFLAMEGASIVEGRAPVAEHEALAGEDVSARLGLAVGDRVVVPGSLVPAAARVEIVGIVAAKGYARDEILVSNTLARGLAGIAPGGVHFIRIRTTDPLNVTALVESVSPTYTYSDVRIDNTSLLAGSRLTLRANLTNWGAASGSKEVLVRAGGDVVARTHVWVPARSTVPFELPVYLDDVGERQLTLNPTFDVTVRPPLAQLRGVPPVFIAGDETRVGVATIAGAPIEGARLRLAGSEAVSDASGGATLRPVATGLQRVEALVGEEVVASSEVFVALPDARNTPRAQPMSLALSSTLASVGEAVRVEVGIANAGGAGGLVGALVRVDGLPRATAEADAAPGTTALATLELADLGVGDHEISVVGLADTQHVEVFAGDARIESALRAREEAARDAGRPLVGQDADDYVERLTRGIALAAAALTIAAAVMVLLAIVVVWSRHLGEHTFEVGVLKAMGARRMEVVNIAAREGALVGVAATGLGMACGVALALAIDASGVVRAFGHRIEPAFTPFGLGSLLVGCLAVNAAIAGLLAGALYDREADALLGRHLLLPPPHEPVPLSTLLARDKEA